MKKKKHIFSLLIGSLLLLTAGYRQYHASKEVSDGLEVYFIDVGQGDSTLIVDDGEAMLIDGGLSSQSQKIYSILKEKGIDTLSYVVATHPHADHVGGLSAALEAADCKQILVPYIESENTTYNKFLNKAEEKDVAVNVVNDGDTFPLGEATLQVLGPTDIIPNEENNNSIVLRMDYKNVSFLFTGDAEQMEEQLILYNHFDEVNADVLKAGHHGSYNAASSAWLHAVSPSYTVISCGKDNVYGHPHIETVDGLKKVGSAIYRTDQQGTITCRTDGKNISFETEKQSQVQETQKVTSGYVLNTRSKKFHTMDCESVNEMAEHNKEISSLTRDEIIQEGYTPCGQCNP